MKLARAQLWLLLALCLPAVVLGGNILRHQFNLAGAQEWRIPITGYDPRDPLRGHYIRFTYDWTVVGDVDACAQGQCQLCLARQGGQVIATIQTDGQQCPARVDAAASDLQLRPRWPLRRMQFTSRIFVSEKSAPQLEAQMRDHRMQVVALIDRNGRLVNRRLEVAPDHPGL